jgi:hypothetical protein
MTGFLSNPSVYSGKGMLSIHRKTEPLCVQDEGVLSSIHRKTEPLSTQEKPKPLRIQGKGVHSVIQGDKQYNYLLTKN